MSGTVQPDDPDPLVNTVIATYTAGIQTATAEASASTNLFQPSVGVTKNCSPDPIRVGQTELCTIVVTNSSSADSPNLVNGTITDTLTGNLLDTANTAIVYSTCTAVLPTGGSCTIDTTRVVLAGDPSPLVNTVTVHYNPDGVPQRHHCFGNGQRDHRVGPRRRSPATGVDLNMAAGAGGASVFAGFMAVLAGDRLRRRRARPGIAE